MKFPAPDCPVLGQNSITQAIQLHFTLQDSTFSAIHATLHKHTILRVFGPLLWTMTLSVTADPAASCPAGSLG